MGVRITKYKVSMWLNHKTNKPVYGVKVYIPGAGWADVCNGKKACLFRTERAALREINSMKKQRDQRGYKIAA